MRISRRWPRLFRPAPLQERAIPRRSSRTWIARSRPRHPDLGELAAADRRHRGHEIAVARAGNANLSRRGPRRLRWRKGDDGRPGLLLRRCQSRYDRLAFHREAEAPGFIEREIESALGPPVREITNPGDPQPIANRKSFNGFAGRIRSCDTQLSIRAAVLDAIDDNPAIALQSPLLSSHHSGGLCLQAIADRSGAYGSKNVSFGKITFMRDEGAGTDLDRNLETLAADEHRGLRSCEHACPPPHQRQAGVG